MTNDLAEKPVIVADIAVTEAVKTRLCIVMGSHWAAKMGGAQYQVKCLLDAIKKRPEFETHYLARFIPRSPVSEGYEIVGIGSGRQLGFARFLSDLPDLYRTLKRLRPSVIYQRCLMPYTGICGLYAARHGARFVFHIAHDDDVRRPVFKGWGPGTLRRRLERHISELGLRRAHAIVAQTADQARMLKDEYNLEATAVIPNFHPPASAAEDGIGSRRGSGLRVVWIANFKPPKNPEIFVDLAEAFRDRNDIEFVMIGRAGDSARYASLHERIQNLRNLTYLGELPIDQVNQQLAASDIFVNTSASEGFPNTFIQAWLRGVPVVSCFVDPDGCLTKGGGGILAGSATNLVPVIADLAENRSRLSALSDSARVHGNTNHRPDAAVRLIDLLLNRDGSR